MRPFPLLAVVMLVFTSGCEGGPERGLPAPTALETRGATLLEEGHDDEARVVFLQALQTAPRSFLAYIGLARAAVGLRDWVLFETAMSEALSTTPKTPEAHDIAGRTLLLAAKAGTGDRRRQHARLAGTMFAHASRQAPDLPQLAYHGAVAEVLGGRPDLAEPLLEAALLERGATGDALELLVSVLRSNHRKARARELLEALEKAGNLPPALEDDLAWSRGEPSAETPATREPSHDHQTHDRTP